MIFTGRLLASGDGVSFWQEAGEGAIVLHLVDRGVVIRLSVDELGALAQASATALVASRETEDRKDRSRRLQILQARVNDYLRRERAEGADSASDPSAREI
ncbi:MAG: hypothetical protein ACRDIY_23775 [Chloroflexota bacterium]